jgi:NDP-sugar pyrophosphorylase family protein
MILYIIKWLKKYGVKEAILVVCYLPDRLKKVLSNSIFGVKIRYIYERCPLGTGGALKRAEKYLDGTTLVMNGDILTDLDLKKMLDFHKKKKAIFTMGLTPVKDPSAYGVVETDGDGNITKFLEKPGYDEISGKNANINGGVYFVEPKAVSFIEADKVVSIERDTFPKLLNKGFCGYISNGIYWMDVGTPRKYKKVCHDILSGVFTPEHKPDVISGRDHYKGFRLRGPASIGKGSTCGKGTLIGHFSVIGADCRIGRNCVIENSIIMDNAKIGDGVLIRGSIAAFKTVIGNYASIERGAVIGEKSVVTDYSLTGGVDE